MRALELASRLPEDVAEAWLAMGERMGGRDEHPLRGHAGRA